MNGYDVYGIYQAIKLHFTSETYNFFTYGGKTRVSVDSFQRRKDKFFFHKLGRKYGEDEIVSFLVANFINSNDTWSKSLLEEEAGLVYMDWKKTVQSMREIFKNDLLQLMPEPNPVEFNSLFLTEGEHPKLLTAYLQKQIKIETMVILNNMVGYIQKWDKKIEDDIIYPKISLKIRKYGSFLEVDVSKYKALTKSLLAVENTI